jgi:DinB superfamily
MRLSHFAIALLAAPIALAAQQPSATPAANPITTSFRNRIGGLDRNIAQAFDSIPGSKFSYKPTPAQLSIGYIAQHVANDNYFFCNQFGALKATAAAEDTATADSVKATWPKAKLLTRLHESVAFCNQALGQLDDSKLGEQVSITYAGNTRTVSRAAMALGHAIDLADHYSQLANYMRLNNLIPPTALPRPRT